VPRGENPRRGNNEDEHDDEDAEVLIASILSLFFAFGNFNSFAQVLSTLYMTKKKNKKGLYFWISFALQTS
jgi:hypothetical protein